MYPEYQKEGLKKQFVPGIRNLLTQMDRYANRAIYGEANEQTVNELMDSM